MSNENVEPFESFTAVCKVLVWAGYCKVADTSSDRLKTIHQLYRPLSFLIILLVNLQHAIFIVQKLNSIEDLLDCLMLEVPHANLLVKHLTLNLQSAKIARIHELIKSPIFAANSITDKELLLQNKRDMHRLCKVMNAAVTMAVVFWPAYYFGKRYLDNAAIVSSYVPFDTNTWSAFTWSIFFEVSPILWHGYGHLALDCLVATYYAQAHVQFKITENNFEHLFDGDHKMIARSPRQTRERDECDASFKDRFVYCIKRHRKIVWYVSAIDGVFNISMSFQFFTSTVSLCMVIYRMSVTPVLSVPFIFLVVVISLLATQVFLYCYYGNLVQYESQSLNSSIYVSKWLSTSPQLRRLMLVAMQRWSIPVTPTVSGIIPLSLTTFISITRSAYSLYAVLRTKQN